uniref:Uncharacterized protein n=1 Tax=uncultured Caudovirales phage TaxID=2100421 RepID=A0A6J5L2J8_9CAUD|nr:hypothetical protein UFOVP114_76 [uncultured Caudovirales phage]
MLDLDVEGQTPALRRLLASKSPVFFDTYYCGMRYAKHREEWLEKWRGWRYEARQRRLKIKALHLAPRDHGKSEAAVTFTTQAICEDRNVRILYIGETQGMANKRLRRVSKLLQSDRVVADYCCDGLGSFKADAKEPWRGNQIVVQRTLESIDPTLEAVGRNGAITGGHFDIIILDDLESPKSVYSAGERAKTREWLKGTVYPMLVRGGLLVVIGTRKHHDDSYAHMKEDPSFRLIEDKAIRKWPQKRGVNGKLEPAWEYLYQIDPKTRRRECIGVRVDAPSEVLWPDERPIEYLLLERQGSTPTLFAREFQHEVLDDKSAQIKWAWLEAARDRGASLSWYERPQVREGWLDVVQGWDLGLVTDAKLAETHDTDFSVGFGAAKDLDANRYAVGMFRGRGLTPGELRAAVIEDYRKLTAARMRPRRVAVENNNFGNLHFIGLQKTTDLPLGPHATNQNKADVWEGLPSLAAQFENGKWTLPSKTEEDRELTLILMTELWGLGREAHDDTALAMWIAELQLRKEPPQHRFAFGGEHTTINDSPANMESAHLPPVQPAEAAPLSKREREELALRGGRAEPSEEMDPDDYEAPEVWADLPYLR